MYEIKRNNKIITHSPNPLRAGDNLVCNKSETVTPNHLLGEALIARCGL